MGNIISILCEKVNASNEFPAFTRNLGIQKFFRSLLGEVDTTGSYVSGTRSERGNDKRVWRYSCALREFSSESFIGQSCWILRISKFDSLNSGENPLSVKRMIV